MRACALAVVLVTCSVAPMAANPSGAAESSRIDGIKALGLESIPGSMRTFYSPHARPRAAYLQRLLGGEVAYYERVFHVSFSPITLAVLDSQQWPVVAGQEPYGMPSVDGTRPAVFVMPASWNEVTWMLVPKREEVPPALLHRALANGKKWDQVRFEGCDGIGTHEIGHSIIRQLGIDPQTRWFNEFLASYVGYAYLKATAPAQALSNEIFWIVGLGNAPHPFTKLDDFENRYEELQQKYPGNYGWYQLALDQRVMKIYSQSGVGYLRTIRREFAAGAPRLDVSQLLDKLERISPGWTRWAEALETPRYLSASAMRLLEAADPALCEREHFGAADRNAHRFFVDQCAGQPVDDVRNDERRVFVGIEPALLEVSGDEEGIDGMYLFETRAVIARIDFRLAESAMNSCERRVLLGCTLKSHSARSGLSELTACRCRCRYSFSERS